MAAKKLLETANILEFLRRGMKIRGSRDVGMNTVT